MQSGNNIGKFSIRKREDGLTVTVSNPLHVSHDFVQLFRKTGVRVLFALGDEGHSVSDRWNYLRREKPLTNGLILTEAASFFPERFVERVSNLRRSSAFKGSRIQAGIPFIRSVRELKILFKKMRVNPLTNKWAGRLLESVEKAQQDGFLEVYLDTLVRNALEWGADLTAVDGLDFMTSRWDERARKALLDVLSMGQYSGLHILLGSKETFTDWEDKFASLNHPVDIHCLPGMLRSDTFTTTNRAINQKEQKSFSDEFIPFLEATHRVLQKMQNTYHVRDFWEAFSLDFIRMPQLNHAQIKPFEIVQSGDKKIIELRIDIRYPKRSIQEYEKTLQAFFESYMDSSSDIMNLDNPSHKGEPVFDRYVKQGWALFGETQTAEGRDGDAGTATAKNEKVVDFSADQIIEALLAAPDDLPEYVIMEVGAWNANGIPEMLRSLHKKICGHASEAELRAKIRKMKFVCIDIVQEGIESCKPVFEELLVELKSAGMEIGGVAYQVCDLLSSEGVDSLQRFQDNVVMVRGINTLDSLESPLYAQRSSNGEKNLYRMDYVTELSKLELGEVLKKPLSYCIDGQSEIIPVDTFSIEAVEHALRAGADNYNSEVEAFIGYFVREGFKRPAALVLWKNVLNIMKKQHRYTLIHDQAELNIVSRVASLHPNLRTPFEISGKAAQTVQALSQLLCTGGKCLFFNLTNSILLKNLLQHVQSRAKTVLGVTPCIPVSHDSIALASAADGFTVTSFPGQQFNNGTTNKLDTSAAMVIQTKPKK